VAGLKYWVWLSALTDVTVQRKLRLLEELGSPENIYYADAEEITRCLQERLRPDCSLLQPHSLMRAEEILALCQQQNIQVMTIADAIYPDRLRNIYDPPVVLYCKGKLPVLEEEAAIALVGTRNASPYGLDAAEKLGFGLAKHGAVVVSGLARGIDSYAVRGALRAGGVTVGVLGGGIDRIYPKENKYLYEDVAATGVLISEYPPGTEPIARNFPVRNRIISGLTLATVVVEAPEKSGALITAATALEQGRDVFAVPGNMDAPNSRGCHQLIRDGAGLAVSSWDILAAYEGRFPDKLKNLRYDMPRTLGYQQRTEQQEQREQKTVKTNPSAKQETAEEKPPLPVIDLTRNRVGMTDDQIAIMRVLSDEVPLQADEIIEQTGIPARRAMSALTVLEIEDYVQQSAGKHFVRTVAIV